MRNEKWKEREREGSIMQKLKRKSYHNGRKTKKEIVKLKLYFYSTSCIINGHCTSFYMI